MKTWGRAILMLLMLCVVAFALVSCFGEPTATTPKETTPAETTAPPPEHICVYDISKDNRAELAEKTKRRQVSHARSPYSSRKSVKIA